MDKKDKIMKKMITKLKALLDSKHTKTGVRWVKGEKIFAKEVGMIISKKRRIMMVMKIIGYQ
jgi:hypothetical protein